MIVIMETHTNAIESKINICCSTYKSWVVHFTPHILQVLDRYWTCSCDIDSKNCRTFRSIDLIQLQYQLVQEQVAWLPTWVCSYVIATEDRLQIATLCNFCCVVLCCMFNNDLKLIVDITNFYSIKFCCVIYIYIFLFLMPTPSRCNIQCHANLGLVDTAVIMINGVKGSYQT